MSDGTVRRDGTHTGVLTRKCSSADPWLNCNPLVANGFTETHAQCESLCKNEASHNDNVLPRFLPTKGHS